MNVSNLSLVLTRPEVTGALSIIRSDLSRVGKIRLEKSITTTADMLEAMQPNNPPFVKIERTKHMLKRFGVVFILEGPTIIQDVVRFVGEHMDPSKCDKQTLRYRLWDLGFFPLPVLMPDGKEYFFNGLHRTKSVEEFLRQAPVILNGHYEKLVGRLVNTQ
ncbi:MAG: hypothetical protein V4524_03860 [Patescibacteria group bacterium]